MSEPTQTPAPQTQTALSGRPPSPPKKIAQGFGDLPPRGPYRRLPTYNGSPPPSIVELYLWLLHFSAIGALVFVWAGYYLLERTWPSSFKLWLCTGLGVSAILHSTFSQGEMFLAVAFFSRSRIRPVHALGIVIIVLAVGVFFTWVTSDAP